MLTTYISNRQPCKGHFGLFFLLPPLKWKSLSHVQHFVTPWTVASQAPLSMEFSRPEHWNRKLFPSPGDLPKPGIKSSSPALQVNSLLSEPPGKPKNIGVGSLSLLQEIFPTQELNWGLLHCRWILYQLSYQGSPTHCLILIGLNNQPPGP